MESWGKRPLQQSQASCASVTICESGTTRLGIIRIMFTENKIRHLFLKKHICIVYRFSFECDHFVGKKRPKSSRSLPDQPAISFAANANWLREERITKQTKATLRLSGSPFNITTPYDSDLHHNIFETSSKPQSDLHPLVNACRTCSRSINKPADGDAVHCF